MLLLLSSSIESSLKSAARLFETYVQYPPEVLDPIHFFTRASTRARIKKSDKPKTAVAFSSSVVSRHMHIRHTFTRKNLFKQLSNITRGRIERQIIHANGEKMLFSVLSHHLVVVSADAFFSRHSYPEIDLISGKGL
jgi:hypothetical protein